MNTKVDPKGVGLDSFYYIWIAIITMFFFFFQIKFFLFFEKIKYKFSRNILKTPTDDLTHIQLNLSYLTTEFSH